MLANGLGGTYVAFKYLYEALGGYKVICWDYRGLYTSAAPKDPQREHDRAPGRRSDRRSSTQEQVGDFVHRRLVDGRAGRLRDDPPCIARACSGMLAINGTYGHAFRTVMGSRIDRPRDPDAAAVDQGAGRRSPGRATQAWSPAPTR